VALWDLVETSKRPFNTPMTCRTWSHSEDFSCRFRAPVPTSGESKNTASRD